MPVIGDDRLGLADFQALLDSTSPLKISEKARARLIEARAIVDEMAAGDEPVYGLNTGLGGNLEYRLKPEDIPDFQMQILRGRAVACGHPLGPQTGRAVLLARIVSAAVGASGMSLELFDHLVAVFNAGISPIVPLYGSIGAGDLVQNAVWALGALGEGEVWLDGKKTDAAEALAKKEIAVPALKAKDGLCLNNHSCLTVALAARALGSAETALAMLKHACVLSIEGYAANQIVFAESLNALRPAPGQAECAAWLREALQGSEHQPRRIQEALSFRTVVAVIGAAEDALKRAVAVCCDELNSSSDSPVVTKEGAMVSTINFHTPALALALENVCLSLVPVAHSSLQRMQKLMNSKLSGLPHYLSPVGEGSAGFVPTQKVAASMLSDIRFHAQPVHFDPPAISDTVEDMAPMTSSVALKLSKQLEPLRLIAGLETLVACQALDLRQPSKTGNLTIALWEHIRSEIEMVKADRSLGADIDRATQMLQAFVEARAKASQ